MGKEHGSTDLRVLSLLHALGDVDELIHEAKRLLLAPAMDESYWRRVCVLGRDLDPENPLFDTSKSLHQLRSEYGELFREGSRRITFDRRKKERRVAQRRRLADRRTDDRRSTVLNWLGRERRENERRQYLRRREDGPDMPQIR